MRTAPDDTPRGRGSTRSRTGDIAMLRRNAPEHSAIIPPGLRVLSIPGRDAPTMAGEVAIAIAITRAAI